MKKKVRGGTQAEKSAKFGQNGLCEVTGKLKMPRTFIFILLKNGCLVTIFYDFIVKSVWTFYINTFSILL